MPVDDQHLAGPIMDGLTVDESSNQWLNRFAFPRRSRRFWLLVGVAMAASRTVGVGDFRLLRIGHDLADPLVGGQISALLVVLPPLIQVVTASGGVHLINDYLVARQTYKADNARWGELKIGWVPSRCRAVTNAIGLGSLLRKPTGAVNDSILAMGVLLTLGVRLRDYSRHGACAV